MQVAIVQHATSRSNFKSTLLLLFSALYKLLVAHNLQPEEASRNGQRPGKEEETDKPEARHPQGDGARKNASITAGTNCRLHGESLRRRVVGGPGFTVS